MSLSNNERNQQWKGGDIRFTSGKSLKIDESNNPIATDTLTASLSINPGKSTVTLKQKSGALIITPLPEGSIEQVNKILSNLYTSVDATEFSHIQRVLHWVQKSEALAQYIGNVEDIFVYRYIAFDISLSLAALEVNNNVSLSTLKAVNVLTSSFRPKLDLALEINQILSNKKFEDKIRPITLRSYDGTVDRKQQFYDELNQFMDNKSRNNGNTMLNKLLGVIYEVRNILFHTRDGGAIQSVLPILNKILLLVIRDILQRVCS